MAHQRQLIREAVKAALTEQRGDPPEYVTAAEDRVAASRTQPWKRSTTFPVIGVYALSENVDDSSRRTAPRRLKRQLQLAIEALVKFDDALDSSIDSLCKQIECAMNRDPTFGRVCADSILSATEIDLVDVGDTPAGLVRLTYDVSYQTACPDEDCAEELVAFERAEIRYSLSGEQDPDDQAVDTLTDIHESEDPEVP